MKALVGYEASYIPCMKFKKEPRIPATKGCKLNALPPTHYFAKCPSLVSALPLSSYSIYRFTRFDNERHLTQTPS